jgi:multimeric flavodoxin WrbA
MKVFMISGSRNREGRTAQCCNAIARGLTKAGGTSELVFLPTMNLERCRQCDPDGWGICRREGRCIIKDDFDSILNKMKEADVVVFANPVYFRDLSESMRGFLDRVRRLNFMQPDRPFNGKPAMGLCLAGGGGNFAPSAGFNLDTILQMCGFDVVDMWNVRRQNIDIKLPMLETVGEWLATKPTSGPMPNPPPR